MLLNFSFSYIKNYTMLIIESSDRTFAIILNIIFILLFLAFVFFSTKYIGKFAGKKMGSKEIKIIEKTTLGFDKSLILIELHGRNYFMYFDKNGFQVINDYEKKDKVIEYEKKDVITEYEKNIET